MSSIHLFNSNNNEKNIVLIISSRATVVATVSFLLKMKFLSEMKTKEKRGSEIKTIEERGLEIKTKEKRYSSSISNNKHLKNIHKLRQRKSDCANILIKLIGLEVTGEYP